MLADEIPAPLLPESERESLARRGLIAVPARAWREAVLVVDAAHDLEEQAEQLAGRVRAFLATCGRRGTAI